MFPLPLYINVGDAPHATPEDQVTTPATLSVGCYEGCEPVSSPDTLVGIANFFPSLVLHRGVLHGV